jgi:amino acid adenylation domain-containing protein
VALLAAFQVLLGRYTGQTDFLIGSPFAGRNRPGFERVIGYFINLLPLRANLSDNPSFPELLGRVGRTVLDALQHQDLPFSVMVERLKIERDRARAPLVQVAFTMEKTHRFGQGGGWRFFLPPSGTAFSVAGLKLEPYDFEQRCCQLDLEMVFEEADGTIEGMLRYNTDLFERATAHRMVGHFLTLLQGIVDDPNRRLSDLPYLTDDERRLVLYDWNRTDADFPDNGLVHHLFERQACRTPEAIALCDDFTSLTYAELDKRANRLAHHLARMEIGRGSLVALCLERSPEMIIAILGTLKAGAAYVPLDPATPALRFRRLLEDTRSPLLLTHRRLVGRLPESAVPVLCVEDSVRDGEVDGGLRPPESGVQPGDLAYVIYTSGSTGRPKGVMVEHRAICNTVLWRNRDLTIVAADRVLCNIPYTFDPSVCVIFPALAAGACLVLADPGEERDPHRLLERMIREGVTVLETLPVILRLMVDDPRFGLCRTLRWACCGGEAMPRDLPNRVLDQLEIELYNLYGPTETAVDATWWRCRRDDPRPRVSIGRPVANARAYILDEELRPVAPGVPGELYVGGAGLARGYLNEPALTAERFVPDPFQVASGSRLYRTGDRCRWLADGSLDFLGRFDDQVKLRGFRIELGEIGAALAEHPEVVETAVIAQPGPSGDSQLIAYVVGKRQAPGLKVATLRRHLKEHLPEWMVPTHILTLPALPRSAGGKLDRRALPPPPTRRPPSAGDYLAPRTRLEAFLAELWCDVLHLDKMGVEDNFFELGGDSIQGAVLINRLQERLGEAVYVVSLFNSPTIAGLARYLAEAHPTAIARMLGDALPMAVPSSSGTEEQAGDNGRHQVGPRGLIVSLQTHGASPPLFMVHPPGGIVICYQALAHRLGRDRPFHAIRSRGLHSKEVLPATMEEMAAEYVLALRTIQEKGPYHLGGWSVGGLVALEIAQQLLAQGERIGLLALLDTSPPVPSDKSTPADTSGREYGLDLSLEQLAMLGPDEQLPYLWEHARKLGLVQPDVPMEVAEQLLNELKRLFHHHLRLAHHYAVRHYPGRITLCRPSDAPFAVATSRDRGWAKLADGVDVYFVSGQHHSMVKEPHVKSLARVLEVCVNGSSVTGGNASLGNGIPRSGDRFGKMKL